MEASPTPPPPAVEPKTKRVKRDLPTGIIYNPAKSKYQARIKGRNDKNKLVQIDRPIPGSWNTSDEAVEKQAAAQRKWDAGEAVWQAPPAGNRNARGQVCPPQCARLVSFTVSQSSFVSQGPKRPAGWADGKKKWNHGAPLSKKTKLEGVGRGNNPKSHGNKPRKEEAKEQLQTVLLPTDREQIRDPTVRPWMASPERPSHDALPPQPPIPVALAPDDDGHPRVRGWLQHEIDNVLREAPVPQRVP
jgi:hypothetical protein